MCLECVKPITASWTTGRNGRHPYYHCKTKGCLLRGKSIQRKVIEEEFEAILRSVRPKEKTLALTKEILLDLWNKRVTDTENVKRSHEHDLDEVRAKIRNLLDRLSKTENESLVRTYENEIEKLTNEQGILENQAQVLRGSKPEFGTALDVTFNFLKNPYLYWKKDDIRAKQLVLKLVFADRIAYQRGVGFGTANLSLPLRVFELNALSDSSKVDPSGFEPLTSSLQMRRSTS